MEKITALFFFGFSTRFFFKILQVFRFVCVLVRVLDTFFAVTVTNWLTKRNLWPSWTVDAPPSTPMKVGTKKLFLSTTSPVSYFHKFAVWCVFSVRHALAFIFRGCFYYERAPSTGRADSLWDCFRTGELESRILRPPVFSSKYLNGSWKLFRLSRRSLNAKALIGTDIENLANITNTDQMTAMER